MGSDSSPTEETRARVMAMMLKQYGISFVLADHVHLYELVNLPDGVKRYKLCQRPNQPMATIILWYGRNRIEKRYLLRTARNRMEPWMNHTIAFGIHRTVEVS